MDGKPGAQPRESEEAEIEPERESRDQGPTLLGWSSEMTPFMIA